tara:strand:- start:3768 stop:5252 length:1485 start_codon:yes stop_codon:yes gene_type:complete
MATWKKVLTASGSEGALLGVDLIEGYSGVADDVLRVQDASGGLAWEPKYTHPLQGANLNLDQNVTAGANNTVLNSVDFGFTVDTLGHVTEIDALTNPTTRVLNLNNFGYTGQTNANYYTHPTDGADASVAISETVTPTDSSDNVFTAIDLNWTVNNLGHVTTLGTNTVGKGSLNLTSIGYGGHATADFYDKWTVTADDGEGQVTTADLGTNSTLAFQGGDNIALALDDSNGTATLTISGEADDLGEIVSVDNGAGIELTDDGGSTINIGDLNNPDIQIHMSEPITLATSGDESAGYLGTNTAGSAGVGHEHAVSVTADGSQNPNKLLAVDSEGLLILMDLTVKGVLDVDGSHVFMDSSEVAFADSVLQINTDAAGTAYEDNDSGVLFGHVNEAKASKLLNTDYSFKLSGLAPGNADAAGAGGTTTVGDPKPLECSHVVAGEAYFGNAWIQGNVDVTGGVEVSDYVRFNVVPSHPTPEDGMLHFDGDKLWVYIGD